MLLISGKTFFENVYIFDVSQKIITNEAQWFQMVY